MYSEIIEHSFLPYPTWKSFKKHKKSKNGDEKTLSPPPPFFGHFNKSESLLTNYIFFRVWMKFAACFQKRSWKYDKTLDIFWSYKLTLVYDSGELEIKIPFDFKIKSSISCGIQFNNAVGNHWKVLEVIDINDDIIKLIEELLQLLQLFELLMRIMINDAPHQIMTLNVDTYCKINTIDLSLLPEFST